MRRSSTGAATSSPVISTPRSRNRLSSALRVGDVVPRGPRERGRLEHRQHVGQPAVAERAVGGRERARPRRRARRSSRGTRPRRGGDRSGRRARRRRRAKSTKAVVPSGAGSTLAAPEAAVRDAHVVQPPDVPPHVVEHRVGDALGLDRGERDALRLAQHEERGVVRPADAGDHDFADGHSRPLGQQQQVRAVLQLLRARERERRARVLVPERAPRLGEQARVGSRRAR